MKNNLNAILLLIAFPLLYIGGNLSNTVLSAIGIALIVIDAVLIIIQSLFLHKRAK